MNNAKIRELARTTSYTLPPTNKYENDDRVFTHTNELIKPNTSSRADNYYYSRATGLKTGYTSYAKNCLVASAENDGLEFICVILGAGQSSSGLSYRYIDAETLLDYAFDNYTIKKIKDENGYVRTVEIPKASKNTKNLDVLIKDSITVLISKEDKDKVLLPEVKLNDNLVAPITAGDVIGTITYNIEDVVYSSELIAANDVKKSSFVPIVIFIVSAIIILLLIKKIIGYNHLKQKKKYLKKRYR